MAVGSEPPTGWELLRAIETLREQHERDLEQMRRDSTAQDDVLRERIIGLEGEKQDSAQFRKAITIAVASAVVASTLSLVVSLVLHFAFA